MESIFGLPTTLLARITFALWLLVTLGIVWLGIHQPVLLRLALRPIPRRKAQTALITLGLMLSTTIMTSSLGAGDTMSHAVRSLVNTSVGRADEVVVLSEPEGWRERRRALRGLRQGDVLAATTRSEFPYAEYERLARRVSDESSIAATVPAIVQLRAVVNERSKLTAPDVKLLAVPADYSPTFGPLATDAGSVHLGDLKSDEVYVNTEAAAALGATMGDRVRVLDPDSFGTSRSWQVRIRAVVRATGLAGSQATIITPLEHVWAHDPGWSADKYLNAILVANSGDANSSVDRSAEATRALRVAVADPEIAMLLHAVLSNPPFRRELESYVEEFEMQAGLLDQDEARLLRALVTEVARPSPSLEFVTLLGDPDLVSELGRFASERWTLEGVYEAGDLLTRLHPLSVREIKRVGLSRADLAGSVITSIFLVLGLFSMAVGVLLIFLLWVMLAAERRTEMGTGRALGLQRRHLLQMFLFEGMLYSALSAALGVLAGVLVARVAVSLLAGIAVRYGVALEPYLAPRSLVLAFSLGALLTLSVVAACSWNISRLTIVAAIRNLPERRNSTGRPGVRRWLRSGAVRAALLLCLGVSLVVAGQRGERVGVRAVGETLLVIGAGELVRWMAGRRGLREADRSVWTVLGLVLLLYWGRPLPDLAESQGLPVRGDIEVFVLSGVLMVLGAVWIVTYNLALLVRGSELVLRRAPRSAVLVRTALAYPRSTRFRTGLVLAMFSLVVFTMVVGSVLTRTTGSAYTDVDTITGGFELTAVSSVPLPQPEQALATASSIPASTFAAVGALVEVEVETIQLSSSVAAWQASHLTVVDDGWLRGSEHRLAARASGYQSDAEVWRALREREGLAVLAPDRGGQEWGMGSPTWVRDPRGGTAFPLAVIGVLDPRSDIEAGLVVGEKSAAAHLQPFDWDQYFYKLASGEDARRAALGLELSFAEQGLQVDLSGDRALRQEAVRVLLNYLLTGFMGLGLLVGIAALGVIATRAVVERRRQIATLRAIGLPPGAVQASLLLESSLVAVLGIAIGVLIGLRVSHNIVNFFARDYPELVYYVPWRQIAVLLVATWGAVLLATAAPAWRAARIPPATGIRVE